MFCFALYTVCTVATRGCVVDVTRACTRSVATASPQAPPPHRPFIGSWKISRYQYDPMNAWTFLDHLTRDFVAGTGGACGGRSQWVGTAPRGQLKRAAPGDYPRFRAGRLDGKLAQGKGGHQCPHPCKYISPWISPDCPRTQANICPLSHAI